MFTEFVLSIDIVTTYELILYKQFIIKARYFPLTSLIISFSISTIDPLMNNIFYDPIIKLSTLIIQVPNQHLWELLIYFIMKEWISSCKIIFLAFILLCSQYAKTLTLFICVITRYVKEYNIINRCLLITEN